jgi:hypothetical protein
LELSNAFCPCNPAAVQILHPLWLLAPFSPAQTAAQSVNPTTPSASPLARHYAEGKKLAYHC